MNRSAILGAVAFTAAVLGTTNTAQAQDAHGFGERNQLMLSADRLMPLFSFTRRSITTTNNNTTTDDITTHSAISLLAGTDLDADAIHTVPRVAVDYTVIPRLTVGGALIFAFGLGGSNSTKISAGGTTNETTNDSPKGTLVGIAPRVGYILPIGDFLAFWPRGGFAFYSLHTSEEIKTGGGPATGTQTHATTATQFSLDLDPQLAIIPLEHLFITVGPLMNIPLTGSFTDKRTTGATTTETSSDLAVFHFGISAGLGGWISL